MHLTGGNITGGDGGAILATNANLTLEGCEINSCNSGFLDGAVAVKSTVSNSLFLSLTNCYIHGNTGSGVSTGGVGSVGYNIANNTFANNSANGVRTVNGDGGTYAISNCTFFNNSPLLTSGNIFVSNIGTALASDLQVYVNNCTIYKGVYSFDIVEATINISNTIMAEPTGAISSQTGDPLGVFNDVGNNISTLTTILGLASTLQNKGGFAPVLPTTAPLGSANVNAIATDQRGAEATGTRDIGAYEYDGAFALNSPAFTVYNTNPFGFGSLYAAINNANNQPTTASNPTIRFNIATTDVGHFVVDAFNRWSIKPINGNAGGWNSLIKDTSHLPVLTRSNTTIDGEATPNTNPLTSANNAKLKIEISGANVGSTSIGLEIEASNCTLLGLNINSFQGIGISILNTATGAVIQGCFIGTNIIGTTDLGNTTDGIFINTASNVLIGGNLPAHQNIISGNGNYGIGIGNGIKITMQGNTIGLNATKTAPIPNGSSGIAVFSSNASSDADRTFIGGTAVNAGNLIAGNLGHGIWIASSSRINIFQNYVGVKADGTLQINQSYGIHITDNSHTISIGNGTATGRNIIAGHPININLPISTFSPHDIDILSNYIGLAPDGTTTLGGGTGIYLGASSAINNIYASQNLIACHTNKGIALENLANQDVEPPVITLATTTSIRGTASNVLTTTVDIYADNTACTPKQGYAYLGTATVDNVGGIGVWVFNPLPALVGRQGQAIVAIQHAGTTGKNTSEFSAPVNMNHIPTTANTLNTKTVLEGAEYTFSTADFSTAYGYADTDLDAFAGIKITEVLGFSQGTLYLDLNENNLVDATETIAGTPAKEILAGNISLLKFKADADAVGMPVASFYFEVFDGKEYSNGTLVPKMDINITPVNDAPTLDNILAQTITKNSLPVTLNITGITAGGGIDEAVQNLDVTATSSNPTLIANPTVAFTAPNAYALTYSLVQPVSVTLPAEVTITVLVEDDGGTANGGVDSIQKTFIISVVPNPEAPFNLLASLESSSSVRLTWDNDFSNATGFEIYRAVGSSSAPFNLLTTLNSAANLTYLDNAVTLGEFYLYRVRSISGVNFSEYSNVSGVRIANVSATPTGLQASLVFGTIDQVALTWTDNSTDEAGFLLERFSVFNKNYLQIADLPAGTTAFTDQNLMANVKYAYRIRSYTSDRQNSPYSNVALVSMPVDERVAPPNPPFSLDATAVSEKQNNLRWEYNTNPSVIYTVERSITANNNFQIIAEYVSPELVPIKNYIDSIGVVAGEIHYYRVKASTAGGNSAYSNIDTVRARCNLKDLAVVRTDNGKDVICANKSASMSVVSKVFGATYQWKRNGIDIPNAKFETFYASQTGVYTCQISAGTCNAISVNGLFVAILNAPDALQILQQDEDLVASINNADAYQWFHDYRPINGATDRAFKPTKPGAYYVVAIVESCTSTSPLFLFNTLSNEQTDLSAYIQLAPNPATLQTALTLDLSAVGKYSIALKDAKGKILKTFQGFKAEPTLRQTLDLKGLPTGLYIVEIGLQGKKGYKKFIVQ